MLYQICQIHNWHVRMIIVIVVKHKASTTSICISNRETLQKSTNDFLQSFSAFNSHHIIMEYIEALYEVDNELPQNEKITDETPYKESHTVKRLKGVD